MFSKRLKNLASFSQLNIISVVNDRSRFPTKPELDVIHTFSYWKQDENDIEAVEHKIKKIHLTPDFVSGEIIFS